jgi:quercetin dioxygenase-like cupin family protein
MHDDLVLPPGAGKLIWLQGLGVRFMLSGDQTGGRFALVEHPIKPKSLAGPLHTHADEDEISYILEGEVGVQIGDRVLQATPGTLVFKPRGVPHAFWNAGQTPARLLEMISPAGFEGYFEAAAALFASGPPDPARVAELTTRYRLDLDLDSIPRLIQAYDLTGS